jgi:hypothetical protein
MLIALPGPSTVSGAMPDASSEAARAEREVEGLELQDIVASRGALGVYVNEAGEFVVVVPSTGRSDFRITDAANVDLAVRVEARDIDQATIDAISKELEAIRPAIKDYAYGFGFDPESGTVVLRSEAPESAFAAIEAAYPGKIAYRPGVFVAASMSSDPQPHSGGAYVQGGGWACTSGFTLDFNAGGRYMVTAGHCFNDGTSTNMGTAWREAPAWPYWDFELISGHTYRPYLYDSGAYTRPVINAWNPSVGSKYCTTGRSSGIKCNWTVRSLNQTICYTQDYPSGACAHNLAGFNQPTGGPIQHGDSGGPLWYSYSSPARAGIRGVISGFFWDIWTFNWMSYATQYTTIADYYVAHAAIAP